MDFNNSPSKPSPSKPGSGALNAVLSWLTSLRLGRLLLTLLAVGLTLGVFVVMPVSYSDWIRVIRQGALHLADPYQVKDVLHIPWTFVLVWPLAILPPRLGAAVLVVVSAMAVALYLRSPFKTLAVAASAPFIFICVLGQIDALVIYGLLLPPIFGLPIIAIKPQTAILTILRRLDYRAFIVLVSIIVLSLVVWPGWPAKTMQYGAVPDPLRNASLFPYTLPLVPFLLYYGLKRQNDALLVLATLCASPYFQTHSIIVALVASAREIEDRRLILLLPVLSWAFYFIHPGPVN